MNYSRKPKKISFYTGVFLLETIMFLILFVIAITSDKPQKEIIVEKQIEPVYIEKEIVLVEGNFNFNPDIPLNEELQKLIYSYSFANGIDYRIIYGIIEQESNFVIDIISKTNDYGLMQINHKNHTWLTNDLEFDNFLNPYQNVISGIRILSILNKKYDDIHHVLMAYNMGEKRANELIRNGVNSTNYSKSVIEKSKKY